MATTTSSVGPTRRAQRAGGEPQGHGGRTDARGGAQPSVGDVADVQPFAGHGGDEGDRTTEQHGEQVERDRGQHDRGPTDEVQPFERLRQRGPVGEALLLTGVLDREDRHDRRQLEGGHERVRRRRPRAVEEPADDRTDDRRARERRRPERDHVGEVALFGEQRRHRTSGGRDHRIDPAHHERDEEQRPDRARVDLAVHDQGHRTPGPTEQEQAGHATPVEAVGHPTTDEDEQHGRDELGEPDPPDVEFVARDVEGLLEQDGDQDVDADRGEGRRPQVAPDGRVPQDISGAGHGRHATDPDRRRSSLVCVGESGCGAPEILTQTWTGGFSPLRRSRRWGSGSRRGRRRPRHRRRRRSPLRRRRRDRRSAA